MFLIETGIEDNYYNKFLNFCNNNNNVTIVYSHNVGTFHYVNIKCNAEIANLFCNEKEIWQKEYDKSKNWLKRIIDYIKG